MIATVTIIWLLAVFVPIIASAEGKHWPWAVWGLSALLFIIPTFTGIHVSNNTGQYTGYVTAVEQNGAIFKGWNAYLKTELESSNEDVACIDRDNPELIKRLQEAQESKENITMKYEGVWAYAIGECPRSDWMIISVTKP